MVQQTGFARRSFCESQALQTVAVDAPRRGSSVKEEPTGVLETLVWRKECDVMQYDVMRSSVAADAPLKTLTQIEVVLVVHCCCYCHNKQQQYHYGH